MSATARGTNRDPRDFYPTPLPSVTPLLPHLPRDVAFWEPCAGDGRLIRVLRESGRKADGSDLFPQHTDAYPMEPTDYLKDFSRREFVLTNPPFGVAFEMCQHAIHHAFEFMFLLRLSFLESEERGDWFEQYEPDGLWVLKKRPQFVMSVTCKSPVPDPEDRHKPRDLRRRVPCKHNWLLPVESERPKTCPTCSGSNLSISTSDNSGYAWFYWGHRTALQGIHHI